MKTFVTASLAAALLGSACGPVLADCAADVANARTAFADTLATATQPGAEREKVTPQNDPAGYSASGGTAPNLPGQGDARAAGTATPDQPAQGQTANAETAAAEPTNAEQLPSVQAPSAGDQQAAAAANGQAPAPGSEQAAVQPPSGDEAQQADQADETRKGNPPSSGDSKGNSTDEAEADLEEERPSLGLALMDINHAEAYAGAGNEELCLQSLSKAEATLDAWNRS